MHDAKAVANAILKRAWRSGRAVTNLDLQKLVYLIHGHYIVETGQPLTSDQFEAWQFGPVQSDLYYALRQYEDRPVTEPVKAFNPVTRQSADIPDIEDQAFTRILDLHLARYLSMTAGQLVTLTHRQGSPWWETVEAAKKRVNLGMRISDSLIEERFEGFIEA